MNTGVTEILNNPGRQFSGVAPAAGAGASLVLFSGMDPDGWPDGRMLVEVYNNDPVNKAVGNIFRTGGTQNLKTNNVALFEILPGKSVPLYYGRNVQIELCGSGADVNITAQEWRKD